MDGHRRTTRPCSRWRSPPQPRISAHAGQPWLSDYDSFAVRAKAKAAEALLQAEIAKMPAAELRPMAAKLARADKLAEQEAAARPGPSPSSW